MDWKPRIDVYLPGEVRQNRLGPIVDIFTAGDETYIAYGALAGVVLCDRQLHYIQTLRIQDAFPSRAEASIGHVQGLRCIKDDNGAKITAWSGKQAVIWKLKGQKSGTVTPSIIWSSITVEQDINYVEYRENHLVIGSDEGVQIYKNTGDKDVPAWSVSQTFAVKQVVKCCFSPSAAFVAWYTLRGTEIYVTEVSRGTQEGRASLPQSLAHRRGVKDIIWRDGHGQDDFYLYTFTTDGAFRLFTVMEDDPTWFQLVASGSTLEVAQIQADLRRRQSSAESSPLPCQPFVAFEVNESLSQKACKSARSRRDEDAAGHDHVFWFNSEGNLFRNMLKGLSRRPPRAIASNRIDTSKPVFSPKDYTSTFKVFCCAPAQNNDYMDIVLAAFGDTEADQLRYLRISLISGLIQDHPIDTALAPISLFRHLPLAGLRSDISGVTFEDEEHLHAIECRSQPGPRWRINSLPKSQDGATRRIYLGSGPVPGILVISPGDCEFRAHSRYESATIKAKCPSALVSLLQSGKQLKNAFGRLSRDSAVVYLLHITSAKPPQIWKVKVSVNEGHMVIKQLKPRSTVDPVASETASAYDDVQIVQKSGNTETAGESPVFHLACVRGGGIESFDISVEDEDFRTLRSNSLRVLPEGLNRVSIDAFGKVATVNNGILRVWDVESARFGSGLEYISDTRHTVHACAFSPEQPHLLAFAYGNTVAVVCLVSYGIKTRWEPVFTIDYSIFSVAAITNLAWIPGHFLFVTNGVQALVLSDVLHRGDRSSNIVDIIGSKRAPLPDAHPENLVQCVIWDKFRLVKFQLKQISLALEEEVGSCHIDLASINVKLYDDQTNHTVQDADPPADRYQNRLKSNNSLWQSLLSSLTAKEAVLRTLGRLGLYKLSLEDVDTLASLSRTMSYADEQAQALDANGRRFLLAFSRFGSVQDDLSHEEATWALHSQSKTVNLQTIISQCHNELILWSDVKRYKLSYWLEDQQITELAEMLARNHFVTEGRNPIPTSIYYFALRKPKTVWGLWRQVSHPERAAMIKFLQNNFEDPRWQSAAVKNAYALLGKQRFQYAAAFFLLGECPKDAIHVCIKQLQDYDLAVFIARTRHDRATLLPWLIETYLQPKAETTGNKWLLHWCHWVQGHKERAIRVIYAPKVNEPATDTVPADAEYHRDDATTMAVLLSDFKSRAETKKLCASVVPIELEMNIVRYSASRLRAIGCQALALSVLRDWHFTPSRRTKAEISSGTSNMDTRTLTESSVSPLEARPVPKERSAIASVIATGPVQDSNETQGGMEFDMGAFF